VRPSIGLEKRYSSRNPTDRGRVDPGSDADLEHAIAGLDAHSLNRVDTSRMQRGPTSGRKSTRDVFVDARKSLLIAVTDSTSGCVGADTLFDRVTRGLE
jgi:hypothetical protein